MARTDQIRAELPAPAAQLLTRNSTAEPADVISATEPRKTRRRAQRVPKSRARSQQLVSATAAATNTEETLPVASSVVKLEPGLFAVEIITDSNTPAGVDVPIPLVWLTHRCSDPGNRLYVLSPDGIGDQWVTAPGRQVAVRVPAGGAVLMAAAVGSADHRPLAPEILIRPLDQAVAEIAARPWSVAAPVSQSPALPLVAEPAPIAPPRQLERPVAVAVEIAIEVTVHIERLGDRKFAGSSWAGRPGDKRRVEGFSIRPLQGLRPNEIEYKVLRSDGVETPWTPGPQFCGSRGQSLPLGGFAIRIAPRVQDQFSVVYQASFFNSGITEVRSNGTPCLPRFAGDILEGLNIRVLQGHI